MDTPITIDDVIIEDSLSGYIDPSWHKGAITYIERFKSVYLQQRQGLIELMVDAWNKERDDYSAQNQILPCVALSISDIDQKYKSMIVCKLEKMQDLAIRQLMHDLPMVLEKFPLN